MVQALSRDILARDRKKCLNYMFIQDNRLSAARMHGLLGSFAMLLVACSGGGGGGGGDSVNLPPTASFFATPAAGQLPLVVALDGTASRDADGFISSYTWDFGDGSAAGSGATTSHTFERAGDFVVRLTVRDDEGETVSTTRIIAVTADPPPDQVVISGKVTFDRVPFGLPGAGLDYSSTVRQPVRQAVIQVLRPDQTLVATTSTSEDGNYSVSVPSDTELFVRVRAESIGSGPPNWSLRVLDNTADDALYVLDGSISTSGMTAQTRDLHAPSGWGGASYTGTRAAAPFAILDTILAAVQFVAANADGAIEFPPLSVFWSKDNRASSSWNPDIGDIQTSLFWPTGFSDSTGIYLLGDDDADTDEYDQHVLAHEFHHYLEATLSRSDSPGGSHSIREKLDMRVSFSEGFANAFSAMVLGDPRYRDSFGPAQVNDFGFDVEENDFQHNSTDAGWYNEGSIHSIVWDIFDAENESGDGVSAGYSPMLEVLRGELRDGQPLGSLFPFIVAVKQRSGVPSEAVEQLVARQGVVAANMDAFASTETNDGANGDVLPVYTNIFLNGETRTLCGNTNDGVYNAIGNRRFLKFEVPSTRTIDIRVAAVSNSNADPDLVLYDGISRVVSECEGPDAASGCTEPQQIERYNATVEAGSYVLEVYDYSHLADNTAPRICMNVSITG